MNTYEAMFIMKPELTEEERKTAFAQLGDAITKQEGKVANAAVWSERRKLFFPIEKYWEGLYYLINFDSPTKSIDALLRANKLNEKRCNSDKYRKR